MTPEWCVLHTATGHTVQGSGLVVFPPVCGDGALVALQLIYV